jgi:hypothetical protein
MKICVRDLDVELWRVKRCSCPIAVEKGHFGHVQRKSINKTLIYEYFIYDCITTSNCVKLLSTAVHIYCSVFSVCSAMS